MTRAGVIIGTRRSAGMCWPRAGGSRSSRPSLQRGHADRPRGERPRISAATSSTRSCSGMKSAPHPRPPFNGSRIYAPVRNPDYNESTIGRTCRCRPGRKSRRSAVPGHAGRSRAACLLESTRGPASVAELQGAQQLRRREALAILPLQPFGIGQKLLAPDRLDMPDRAPERGAETPAEH